MPEQVVVWDLETIPDLEALEWTIEGTAGSLEAGATTVLSDPQSCCAGRASLDQRVRTMAIVSSAG